MTVEVAQSVMLTYGECYQWSPNVKIKICNSVCLFAVLLAFFVKLTFNVLISAHFGQSLCSFATFAANSHKTFLPV